MHGGTGAGPVLKSVEEEDPGPAGEKAHSKCSMKTWSSIQEKEKKKKPEGRKSSYCVLVPSLYLS